VSGPLKIVKEDILFAILTDASHAIFAGPGASRPSRSAGFPPTVYASVAVHERSGLASRSGMEDAILLTVAVWELSSVAIASAGVASRADSLKAHFG